jgi:RNA polymerase sigma factor (TIGR02999 family)
MQETSDALIRPSHSDDQEELPHLFVSLYRDLHRLAQRELRRNGSTTLSPTTLLHETFLNVSQRESIEFADPAQFRFYVARAMRGLVIDYFRSRRAQKRGGAVEITVLPTELPATDNNGVEVERLGEALDKLEEIDTRLAECVDLKFFGGYSLGEIARMWDVSERTVQRAWDKARLLLEHFMRGPVASASPTLVPAPE